MKGVFLAALDTLGGHGMGEDQNKDPWRTPGV